MTRQRRVAADVWGNLVICTDVPTFRHYSEESNFLLCFSYKTRIYGKGTCVSSNLKCWASLKPLFTTRNCVMTNLSCSDSDGPDRGLWEWQGLLHRHPEQCRHHDHQKAEEERDSAPLEPTRAGQMAQWGKILDTVSTKFSKPNLSCILSVPLSSNCWHFLCGQKVKFFRKFFSKFIAFHINRGYFYEAGST